MRYAIALLFLLVSGAPALSAQAVFSPSPLQGLSAAAPLALPGDRFPGARFLQADPVTVAAPALPARTSSLGRHVGWGTLLGASAGVVSSLLVLSLCDEFCDGSRAAGFALHVGVGAAGGAAAGAIVHRLRR